MTWRKGNPVPLEENEQWNGWEQQCVWCDDHGGRRWHCDDGNGWFFCSRCLVRGLKRKAELTDSLVLWREELTKAERRRR